MRDEATLSGVTVTRLCEQLGLALGLPGEDLKMRARALRVGGLLPLATKRGPSAPLATTRNAAVILLATLGQGTQSRAAAITANLWELRYQRTEMVTTSNDPRGATTRREEITIPAQLTEQLRNLNLGALICYGINQCRTTQGRQEMLNSMKALHCWADGRMALVETHDGRQLWYGRDNHPNNPPPAMAWARVGFMASVPSVVLAIIADMTIIPPSAQAELPLADAAKLPAETKTAPRPEASGAVNSMMSKQPGKAENPYQQTDDATSGDSDTRGERIGTSESVTNGLKSQSEEYRIGKVEPLRAARGP